MQYYRLNFEQTLINCCNVFLQGAEDALPRCKPFKYTYEKEIVM